MEHKSAPESMRYEITYITPLGKEAKQIVTLNPGETYNLREIANKLPNDRRYWHIKNKIEL